MEIEVDPTHGTVAVRLAEYNGQVPIQRDAVSQTGRPCFVGFDGLVEERLE